MKIITTVRTLNEERNIEAFCEGYAFSDLILVADGGSTDKTLALASRFDNVRIKTFDQRRYLRSGRFMNPEPAHLNFLTEWAETEGADWTIRDDCDSHPNPCLRQHARSFFDKAERLGRDGINLHRLYMWGIDQFFPKMNQAGYASWAFRASLQLRADEGVDTLFETMAPIPDIDNCLVLECPYVCLHYFDPNSKVQRYTDWGQVHKLIQETIYWPPAPLPSWVFDERCVTDDCNAFWQVAQVQSVRVAKAV